MQHEVAIDELLAQAGWLRGLAASLVSDAGRAEDLVQDTWVAVLRRPPVVEVAPRRWLGRVARNLASNARRSERRRAEHETRAGESGPSPAPDVLAQQAETQRVLAAEVVALEEPLRSVVVLRYFHALDSEAIARELGVPAGTVRWRLKQALEELRLRLDRRFEGGRAAWVLGLARLARLATTATPVAAVGSYAVPVLLGAFGLLVVGAFWTLGRGSSERTESVLAHAAVPAVAGVEPGSEGIDPPTLARVPVEPGDSEPAAVAVTESTPRGLELSGTVLVIGGTRPRDFELDLREASATSGQASALAERERRPAARFTIVHVRSGQTFSFPALPEGWNGILRAPGFVFENGRSTLRVSLPSPPLLLRLVEQPALAGRVLDVRGDPARSVEGKYQFRVGVLPEEGSQLELGPLATDEDGFFHVELSDPGPPAHAALLLELDSGYALVESAEFDSSLGHDFGDVQLEPTRAVSFRVRDESGQPIAGAVARLHGPFLLARASEPSDGAGEGVLTFAPERAISLRLSALGREDGFAQAGLGSLPEVALGVLPTLELRLIAPQGLALDSLTVCISSRDDLWPFFEGESPLDEQGLLGAASPFESKVTPGDPDSKFRRRYRTDGEGRLVLTGLLPDFPFQVEVQDEDGHSLAVRRTAVGAREWQRLELALGR